MHTKPEHVVNTLVAWDLAHKFWLPFLPEPLCAVLAICALVVYRDGATIMQMLAAVRSMFGRG